MKLAKIVSVIAVGFVSLPVLAADGNPFEGEGFVKSDWQLVCDNTLTCQAAGYTDDMTRSDNNKVASLLLSIKAGDKTAVGQVQLNNWEDVEQERQVNEQLSKTNYQVTLYLNNKSYGVVPLSADRIGQLSPKQTQQLIQRARQNTQIHFRSGNLQWQVSDVGLAAILLKLDDVQGRIGSSLALVSKGANTKYKGLTPAVATPKIYAAHAYPITEYTDFEHIIDGKINGMPTAEAYKYQQLNARYDKQWQAKMSAWGMSALTQSDADTCDILTSDASWVDKKDKAWRFSAIDAKHTLASHLCWRGAYNEGIGYWLIDNANPSNPKLITTSGSDYDTGNLFSAQKGRGLGDCWYTQAWVWDGKGFAKTSEMTTGLCRGVQAGGAWKLPTYVSEVTELTQD